MSVTVTRIPSITDSTEARAALREGLLDAATSPRIDALAELVALDSEGAHKPETFRARADLAAYEAMVGRAVDEILPAVASLLGEALERELPWRSAS